MQEKVTLKNKKAARVSALLMIFAVAAFAFAKAAGAGAFLLQALGLLSAAVGISMLIRYVLTDYLYSLEDGHFAVRKINGKKSLLVADIPLCDITSPPLTSAQYQKRSSETGKTRVFSFITNLDSPDECYLFCNVGGESYVLRLELTEAFRSALCEAIERARIQKEREEIDEDIEDEG